MTVLMLLLKFYCDLPLPMLMKPHYHQRCLQCLPRKYCLGSTIATSSVTDPEAGAITYSLSGTGSENFSVQCRWHGDFSQQLDYETATAYEITFNCLRWSQYQFLKLSPSMLEISMKHQPLPQPVAAESFAEDAAKGTTLPPATAIQNPAPSLIHFGPVVITLVLMPTVM